MSSGGMSLTSQLSRKDSAARRFMDGELPNVREVTLEANATIRAGRGGDAPLAPVHAGVGVDGSLVGTAIEFVLAVRCGDARKPAGWSEAPTAELLDRKIVATDLLGGELRRLGDEGLALGSNLERAADCALACARMEHLWRSHREGSECSMITHPADGIIEGLDGVVAATHASAQTRADLLALLVAALPDTADLYSARSLAVHPGFDIALSHAIGGADADVIADGVLVDFKSSKSRSVVRLGDIYQLVGYTLLDQADEYHIRAIGIQALRWRKRWTIPVDNVLSRLSGVQRPLDEWRAMFASAISPVPTPPYAPAPLHNLSQRYVRSSPVEMTGRGCGVFSRA